MEPALVKILVVEDNIHTREILRFGVGRLLDAVTEDGASVAVHIREAEEGRAAVQMLETESFDLVLTDYYMPIMDGAETIRRMRETHPSTPIVATSASYDARETLMNAGATAFVQKPLRSKDLLQTLKTLLHLR